MSGQRRSVWFWQRMVSPHMAGLAAALAQQGCDVVYVAEQVMSADRASHGWIAPDLGAVRFELAPTEAAVALLVYAAPGDSVHICQGIRANGLVGVAQRILAERRLRQWVVMETVDDWGWRGFLKRLEYRRLFACWRGKIEGVLATGQRTPAWVVARGVPAARVFPFAYFLPGVEIPCEREEMPNGVFRFIFVGRLIELKRLDLLIDALAKLGRQDVELLVIGSGPLERQLREAAEEVLPGRVRWTGQLPINEVPKVMALADCLVLPSRHDGWGAVVSEALMVGTSAVCSDRCGSAGVVRASGYGSIFRSGDIYRLVDGLREVIARGRLSELERNKLAQWARCLGAAAGAEYLRCVLAFSEGRGTRPAPPWTKARA